MAAGSASLPETPGGNRNYDYRFTWIRDATFALWGMYSLGFDWEAVDFYSFIAEIAEKRRQPADHVRHRRGARAHRGPSSTTCPGYADSRPVRIGNAAYAQQQHDVWGALLDSVYLHSKAVDYLDNRVWPILEKQVGEALKHWREPDAGHLGGARRAEALHVVEDHVLGRRSTGAPGSRPWWARSGKAAEWQLAAEEIKQDILANGVDERGVLTQYYGSTALDASLLLAPLVRFLPADDPRIRATVLAIRDELTVDGLVLRYKVEETDDGFSGEEGTFTICSFWLVSALCEIGEVAQGAQALREAALVRRSAGALRRGDRPEQRPAPGQLPPGLHPPRADQRGAARHPPGGGTRVRGGGGRPEGDRAGEIGEPPPQLSARQSTRCRTASAPSAPNAAAARVAACPLSRPRTRCLTRGPRAGRR